MCEPEVADLLADLDPSVYVIDCMPNMEADLVDERLRYLLGALKEKRARTPVILVEEPAHGSAFIREDGAGDDTPKNLVLQSIYKELGPDWNGLLSYVRGGELLGDDGEATVDGLHPTELGFERMADALTPALSAALNVGSLVKGSYRK